jgi:hypothetical protein
MKKFMYYGTIILLVLTNIIFANTEANAKDVNIIGNGLMQFDNDHGKNVPEEPKNQWDILSKDLENVRIPVQGKQILFTLPLGAGTVAISADSKWVVAQFPAKIQDDLNDDIKVFDNYKKEWISLVPEGRHFGNGTYGSFSPDGKFIIVTAQYAPAILYEIGNWSQPENLQNETLWPHSNYFWSPNSKLVFHIESEPGIAIFVTDLNRYVKPILDYDDTGLDSNMDFSTWGPDWYPDSNRILYTDVVTRNTEYIKQLRLIDLHKNKNILLAFGLKGYEPDLSPDGKIVLLQGKEKLFLYHPDSNYYDEIKYDLPMMVSPHPTWGKDSKRLILNTYDGAYIYSLVSNRLWKVSEKDTTILQMANKGCKADIYYNTEKEKKVFQYTLPEEICTK